MKAQRSLRFFSRISFRLLAFNLLLVFLPVAGVLFLGAYEARLETAEVRSMTEQARIVAAVIAREGTLDPRSISELLLRANLRAIRFRIVDRDGVVVADSREVLPAPVVAERVSPRQNVLYRIAAFAGRPILRFFRPPELEIAPDFYEGAQRMRGAEVREALGGRESFDKKITAGGQRSVTLYRAVPIVSGGWVIGAVVASQSTYPILQDLYAVRLAVTRIFLASVVAAVVVSILFSTTIVRPLRQLRVDARRILDRRAGLAAHFKGSRRRDEIGELSRALERIMRRLDEYVKLVEAFAADVSHEFKNPLASIRNANEMLADVNDPADRRRFVKMIEQEVARMEKLLAGVREISTIDAQLAREEALPVDVTRLLARIVDGFRMREGPRVVFHTDLGESIVVHASEERLIQVFENLLDNAASFSPHGGAVGVAARATNGSAVISVADEGPGIPDNHLDRIFDRFFTFRPPAARRDAAGHTGLGLAIVKAIVEAYGGSVRASNRERGALFEIRLPRAI